MLKNFLRSLLGLIPFTLIGQERKAKKEIRNISRDLEGYLEGRQSPLYDWVKNLPGFSPESIVLAPVQIRILDDAITWAEYELTKRALEGLIRCTVNSAKIEAYRKYLDGMRMKNSEFYANRAKKHLASKGIDVNSLEKKIDTMHLGFIFHCMDIT